MKSLQFAVGMLVTFASGSLYAQSLSARANIPFEFRVGEKLMPAGEYMVRYTNSVLEIQKNDGRRVTALAATHAVDLPPENPEKAALQFNRYGDNYFLGRFSIPGADVARALQKTPREKELARATKPGQTMIAFESK